MLNEVGEPPETTTTFDAEVMIVILLLLSLLLERSPTSLVFIAENSGRNIWYPLPRAVRTSDRPRTGLVQITHLCKPCPGLN